MRHHTAPARNGAEIRSVTTGFISGVFRSSIYFIQFTQRFTFSISDEEGKMLTWAIAWVIVSGAATWPLLLAGILGDIVLALVAMAAVSAGRKKE